MDDLSFAEAVCPQIRALMAQAHEQNLAIPNRSFAQMQAEAEARSSAGGGGGGGGVPNWEVHMQAAAPEEMEGIIDGKLKHQQDQIEHQKTTIEKLQANVKTMEAVNIQSLIEYQKSMEDCHAKYQKSMMDCRANMDKSTLDCRAELKHQQDKIDQQNTTIEKLELKIQTLELTKGGGAGGGAGGGKRKSPPRTHTHTVTQDGVLYSDRSEHESWQSARPRRSLEWEGDSV